VDRRGGGGALEVPDWPSTAWNGRRPRSEEGVCERAFFRVVCKSVTWAFGGEGDGGEVGGGEGGGGDGSGGDGGGKGCVGKGAAASVVGGREAAARAVAARAAAARARR
jgi:hypothetical protein